MPELGAKVATSYEFTGEVTGQDGYTCDLRMDDSFYGWRQIVKWNWHFRHWRVLLRLNLPDLFTKVLRRKLWRR